MFSLIIHMEFGETELAHPKAQSVSPKLQRKSVGRKGGIPGSRVSSMECGLLGDGQVWPGVWP